MKELMKLLSICCLFVLCFTISSLPLYAQNGKDVSAGKLLVKFKASATARLQQSTGAASRQTGKPNTGIAAFDAAARKVNGTALKRVFPYAGKMEARQQRHGLDRWYVMEIDPSVSVQSAMASFKNVGEVEATAPVYKVISVQPYKVKPVIASKISTMDAEPVNDPYYPLQWHYHNTGQTGGYKGADINLPEAWKITSGRPEVIVDVVDEGVDYSHEDLAANMWKNDAELHGQPGVDDDGNGYVDDVYGYNFADKTGAIVPGDHGTHTAGTIGAVNNNGIGVAGIAGGSGKGDGVRIMSSEIFGANSADGAATAAAIVYGANNGAVISQNSWGYNSPNVYDQLVLDAIDYFIKEAGRDENGKQVGPMDGGVVIFASGNNNISDPSYPAYYSPAIAVSSTTVFDNKSSFSNYGAWVDISAPGGELNVPDNQQVASTVAGNKYGYMSGTSMACPHVSGVAALIVSQFGKQGFTNVDLKNRLFATVDKFLALNPAYNGMMGVGRLNAGRALQPDKALPPVKITDLAGISTAQNSIDLSWTSPSDPDNGNAQNYTVYYAAHLFDSTQKDTLQKVIITKAMAAGAKESYSLSGLLPSTEYYIAVTAKDLWGNESNLSNIVRIITMQGAIINLPSTAFTLNINVTNKPIESTSFKLGNTGKAMLDYTATAVPVATSWARSEGFNDTLRYTKNTWIGGYVGDDEKVPFAAATRFYVKNKAFSLTHIANGIQTQGIDKPIWASVYKGGADPAKGTLLIKQLVTGASEWGDLLVTKLNGMYLFQPGEWFWVVYEYDEDYAFAQGYEGDANDSLSANFLASSNNGKTWPTIASLFKNVSYYTYALSNDGYYNFVTLQPGSGSVAGGASSNITAIANAATVRNGTYEFRLTVNSNDLNNPSAGVPLTVNVTGQTASLATASGLLDCRSVFIGKTGEASVRLYNAGLSKLYNLSFTSSSQLFTKVALPDTLYPGDSGLVTVSFKPVAAGLQQASITIGSNGGTVQLSATGTGIEPPVMHITGVPLQIVAKADSAGKNSFVIANKQGKYPLNYSFPGIAAIKKAKAKGLLAEGSEPYGAYVWIDDKETGGPVYNWNDISRTGRDITAELASEARTAKLFDLGFSMRVNDDTVSQLYVTGLGLLSFSYPGDMNVFSANMPIANDGVNGCIAPLWYQDSRPVINANMKVFVKYEPGKFIVQYNDVEKFEGGFFGGGSFSLGKATYQVTLYSDGKVSISYKDVSNAQWISAAVIGMENRAETKGFNIADFTLPSPWTPTDNSTVWLVPVMPKFIISAQPLNGAVAPGDSVKITVTASAKGLIDSVYTNTLDLTTNDPVNEQTTIPVLLTVTGVKGILQKTDSLHFGNQYKGAVVQQDAVLMNTGSKPVQLLGVSFDNTAFSSAVTAVSIPAFSEIRIPVKFTPVSEAAYTGILTITTDNPSHPVFKIILDGKGTAAPGLLYSLAGGEDKTLKISETANGNIQLSNNGSSDLQFTIEHPQWMQVAGGDSAGNILKTAATYSVHNSIDSTSAAYHWIELSDSLGKPAIVDQQALPFQELVLPFAFPFYGKNYHSLFLNYWGDLYINNPGTIKEIRGGFPSTDAPNGLIATAGVPMYRRYDDINGKYEGEIYYYADSNKLVVEFYKMVYYNFFASGTVTYEAVIYKDGRIKLMYKEGENSANFTHEFLAGIENEDGTDGVMAYNKSYFWKDKRAIEFVPSASYVLKAGQSTEVPLTWTTNSMTDGVYNDRLRISSNDPLKPVLEIPLKLTVIGSYQTVMNDSINYGKLSAAMDDGVTRQYKKQFTISNNGYKTVTIAEASFSNDHLGFEKEIVFPLVLAPGENYSNNVLFTPDSLMQEFHETLVLVTDEVNKETVKIPVTAMVVLPAVLTTDSTSIRMVIQQADTATRFMQIINTGKSELNYQLSVLYRRPGITYNSVQSSPLPGSKIQPGNAIKTIAGAAPVELLNETEESFADSLIMPVPGNNMFNYMGTADDNLPILSATKFNTGNRSFNLSHIGNLYRNSSPYNASVKLRIRLGNNINSSTVVREQSVDLASDTLGRYVVIKLDSALLLYPNEDFWVEWEYAKGMQFPQGIQFVPNAQALPQTFYYRFPDEASFREDYIAWRYVVNAYADADSSANKGWLSLTPLSSVVEEGKSQQLTITVHGPQVMPAEQAADIVISSNDVANPVKKLRVSVRIDQAPYLTAHDTLSVNEADTLVYLLPAKDAEGSRIKIITADSTLVKIREEDSLHYLVYTPGYTDSGWHSLSIELSDAFQNKRKDSVLVHVLNVNRSPVIKAHEDSLTLYVGDPAYQLALDSIISDPDGDTLLYRFIGDTTSIADIYVDVNGKVSLIPKDTGSVQLRFTATDPFEATVADTLTLYIKTNTPPVATAIPTIVVEAGAPAVSFNLGNWFTDADSTDILSYTAAIDSVALASVTVNDSSLSVKGLSAGNTIVHVTASDGHAGKVTGSFLLTVLNNKGNIVDDYHITVAPNPVRSIANIRMQLGTAKKVRIDVVGMNGKLQAVLFDGNKPAGNHQVQANLAALAAGNYLVRFTIDGKTGIVQIAKL